MTIHPLRDVSIEDLRRRTSLKWTLYPDDVLPMFVAEMDAHPVPAVVEAVERAVRDGDTGYPHGAAYAEAFARFASDRWGWRADPALMVGVADVMTGMREAVRLVSRPGDPVIVNPPVYAPFYATVSRTERELVEVPLTQTGRLDLEGLAEAFARVAGSGTYLLCSPHNPTSVVHTRDELAVVARLATEHRVRVVVDEIHAPLTAGFVPFLSVPGSDQAIVATSASKAFNLAGFKAGLLVFGSAARNDLDLLPPTVGHGLSHLGVTAHTAAFDDGREWLDGLPGDLAENRAQFGSLLGEQAPDLRWNGEAGTYLAWIDARGLGWNGEVADRLLRDGRVALNPGSEFGRGFGQYVRVNLATTPELIVEGVARIAASI